MSNTVEKISKNEGDSSESNIAKDINDIKMELCSLNYKLGMLTGKIEKFREDNDIEVNGTRKSIEKLDHKIVTTGLELKVEIIKYISENSWKTVSLLLAAQTGILTVFGFVQHFFGN